jgi:hypothetical protein
LEQPFERRNLGQHGPQPGRRWDPNLFQGSVYETSVPVPGPGHNGHLVRLRVSLRKQSLDPPRYPRCLPNRIGSGLHEWSWCRRLLLSNDRRAPRRQPIPLGRFVFQRQVDTNFHIVLVGQGPEQPLSRSERRHAEHVQSVRAADRVRQSARFDAPGHHGVDGARIVELTLLQL